MVMGLRGPSSSCVKRRSEVTNQRARALLVREGGWRGQAGQQQISLFGRGGDV